MRIGFSGTRYGMSNLQLLQVKEIIRLYKPVEFHHGDCYGADRQAARIVLAWRKETGLDCRVIAHPGMPWDNEDKSGYDVALPQFPNLKRNRDIVDATDILIAAPQSGDEVKRSGTWATIRYADMYSRKYIIIAPDGFSRRYI